MSEAESNTTTQQTEQTNTEQTENQAENPPESGEQSTTAASEEQTTTAASGEQSTTAATEEQTTTAASGEQSTTAASEEQTTTAASGEQTTTAASGEQSTTAAASGEQSTTAASGEQSAAAASGEQSTAANGEQPANSSSPAKKEDKPDTKLPKEFKRGYDISHYQLERLLDNQKGLFLFASTNHKDDEPATLRIERIDPKHPGLLNEVAVIPYLSESLSFPRFYEWGEQNGFRWVSCELLGPSLKFVKWKIPKQRFTQYSALHGSLALLRCIEDLHKRGFVHGDIQPDNILIRPNKDHPLVLSNFQMAKRYCWPEGVSELPPLDQTPASIDISKMTENNEIVVVDDYGFKNAKNDGSEQQPSESQTNENSNADNNNEGSNADEKVESEGPQIRDPTIFDSVNALQGGEVTRVDDLESWFYVMVDMLEGKLPFSSPSGQSATRESILSAKQGASPDTLTKDLPDQLKDCWTYISSLTPTDEPDYDKIGKFIVDTIQDLKLIPDDYDWNKLPVRKVKKISAIDFRALNGENNYLPIFDHERNVSQTPPPPPANCLIA